MKINRLDQTIELGTYLRKERLRAGYRSQRLLANISGVSAATISRIESGLQLPDPSTLSLLSQALGIANEELMQKAGYLEHNHMKGVNEGVHQHSAGELVQLQTENALLKAQVRHLKEAIKNLTKGW